MTVCESHVFLGLPAIQECAAVNSNRQNQADLLKAIEFNKTTI
jgi:hypothetical protein